jgi:hypothetical protein
MTENEELPPGAERLPVIITLDGGVVTMRFLKPICHLCMSPGIAVSMAEALVTFAARADARREHAEAEAKSITEALLKKAGFTPAKQ